MTERYKRGAQWILGLFILSIGLTSCVKEDELISPNLNHPSSFNVVDVDTISLRTWTHNLPFVHGNSYYTLLPNHNVETNFIVGEINDPDFGIVESDFYTNLILLEDSIFIEEIAIDSIVFYCPTRGNYGKDDYPINYQISLLNSPLEDTVYYSNQTQELALDFGEKTIEYNNMDTVNDPYGNPIKTLTIKASDDFVSSYITNLNGLSNTYLNKEDAKLFMPGIKLAHVPQNPTLENGGLVYFDANSSNFKVKVYHTNADNSKSTMTFVSKNVSKYNYFDHDYSLTTNLNNQFADSTLGQQLIYLQGMSGTEICISMNGLKSIFDENPSSKATSATLKLYLTQLDTPNYELPPRILLYAVTNGEYKYLGDNYYFEGSQSGVLQEDEIGHFYELSLANFLNENKSELNFDYFALRLGGVSQDEENYFYSGKVFQGNRVILAGPEFSDENKVLKLSLTLTDI